MEREILQGLVGGECAATLLDAAADLSLDVIKSPCFSLLISKTLGFGIIVGGSIVKLPQIIKIIRAQTTKGISLSSYLLESFGYTVTLAYNMRKENPFSTYGESMYLFHYYFCCLLLFGFILLVR